MQEEFRSRKVNNSALELAISKQRLGRYCHNRDYNIEDAVAIYLWNCRLAEAFNFSTHVCEIVVRNSIQKSLRVRFANPWFEQYAFLSLLDRKHQDDLSRTISEEKELHKSRMSDDHIVSSLSFGFWEHLTTKRFDRTLWLRGIKHSFPNAFKVGLTIRAVNARIQTARQWRNRVAHHRALFDREPDRKFEERVALIGWTCEDAALWVRQNSTVLAVLQECPAPLGAIQSRMPDSKLG
jgi:hypothetical protein